MLGCLIKEFSFNDLDERIKFLLIVFFLIIGVIYSQFSQDSNKRSRVYSATYNQYIQPLALSGEGITNVSFGFKELIADYYWLKTIQYYGGGDPNGKYEQLPKLYNSVLELSPRFLSAYESGILILGGEGFVKDAINLANVGQKNLPLSWQIPYYQGLIEHIYNKNYKAAANLFDQAAKLPGAPPNTKYFAGIYYSQANNPDIAYAIFKTIYENSTDPAIKERAGNYVIYLENVTLLNKALTQYKIKFSKPPNSLSDLVKQKIITEIPQNPLEFDYYYDKKIGKVLTAKPL
ncbi:hypothetical protein HY844_02165 [Candidatus Berkelbacteria bacterium]|nr:hypothetical protein [Candidatus Berkelbacteria bacterium]